jgi:soluble P-type ATPase
MEIVVPGFADLHLDHMVLDYNGTLALDGYLLEGVADRLKAIAGQLQVHIVTADTFGRVQAAMADLPCRVSILPPGAQDVSKLNYIQQLNPERVVCIGNGRNDWLMLQAAALGIAVLQTEGVAAQTIAAADVVVPTILAAFDMLLQPLRLVATLRS